MIAATATSSILTACPTAPSPPSPDASGASTCADASGLEAIMAGHDDREGRGAGGPGPVDGVKLPRILTREWSERAFVSDTVPDPVVIAQRSLNLSNMA